MSVRIPVLQGRGMTMSDQLARHARTIPDAPALRFDGGGRSYAELDERVTRLARALQQRGVATGDGIAVLALNGMEAWETYLAEELAAYCREKLARYKNPREYSVVGALPRNPSGKVLKTALRQEHSAGSLVAEPVV